MPDEAYHVAYGGASDGGKTTRLREHHETFEAPSIWVNYEVNGEYTEGVAGYRCMTYESCMTGLGRYDDWSNVRLNLRGDDPMQMTATAIEVAIDLWDTAGVPCQIIIDECHHVIPPDADGPDANPAMWGIHEGRDKGIKMVVATQNPTNMAYKRMDSVKYWGWVGEWSTAAKGFMDYYGFPTDEMPGEPYHVTIFNRQMETVFTGETKVEYAQ